MRSIVTGGAGFIGSHLADELLARGDEVHVVDDLSNGRRENVAAGATLHEQDVRESLDAIAAAVEPDGDLPSRSAGRRPRVGRRPGRRRERQRARHDQRARGGTQARRAGRSSPRRAGPSTASAPALRVRTTRASRCRRTAQPSSRVRSTSPCSRGSTARSTSRSGSRTSTGPGRIPTARPAWWRSSSGTSARASRAGSSATGDQIRDYVFVGDVVRAVVAALRKPAGGVVNVGTGTETSVSELYEACRAVAGSDAEAVHEPARPGELARSVLDMSLAERELGFRPETTLAAGIAATWAHIAAR